MGYWEIVISGQGAHHNPDYEKDANRMASEFVKLLKANHQVSRAAFLFDYKGEHAGDTLPYVEGKEPWVILREQRIAEDALRAKLAGPSPVILGEDEHKRQQQVSGGAPEVKETTTVEFPAPGVLFRRNGFYEHNGEPWENEATYDLDLGYDHYIAWEHSTLDGQDGVAWADRVRATKPTGGTLYHRLASNPGGWCSGAFTLDQPETPTFARWHGEPGKGTPAALWTVDSWEPFSFSPSFACHCKQDHGFVKSGRWMAA